MKENFKILDNIAPALASALRGPFAEVGKNYIIEQLANDHDKEAFASSELVKKLLSKPGNMALIKEVDAQFAGEMKEHKIDIFSLEEKPYKEKHTNMSPQMIISITFLCFYFLIISAVFYVEVDDNINNMKGENSLMGNLEILLGVITAGVGQILNYWFGGIFKLKEAADEQKTTANTHAK